MSDRNVGRYEKDGRLKSSPGSCGQGLDGLSLHGLFIVRPFQSRIKKGQNNVLFLQLKI